MKMCLFNPLNLFLLFLIIPNVYSGCRDYTIDGRYENKIYMTGLPDGGITNRTKKHPLGTNVSYNFVDRPANISVCQLKKLHKFCISEINRYRSGILKFSDGTDDSNVLNGLEPYVHNYKNNKCSSESSMGALVVNYEQNSGCDGGHANAFVCPWRKNAGQNSCCGRGHYSFNRWDLKKYNTYDIIKSELSYCLRTMWNEGMITNTGQKGHWKAMRSETFRYVSCGFAWSAEGRVMMRQDFTGLVDSEWYCQKPGKNKGNFRKEHCELPCGNKNFKNSRCCYKLAGSRCTKKEIIDIVNCKSAKPTC
jgi:hypothetical protein